LLGRETSPVPGIFPRANDIQVGGGNRNSDIFH
jgi:hypothetical protein